MTRDELLAAVHVLEPGDLLYVRINREDVTAETADKVAQLVKAKVPAGVDVIVSGNDVSLEQYRLVEP